MTINLGMPKPPPPVLAPRRPTRKIKVGKVFVGGDAPVSVQSMTTTKTTDINGTLQQIAELTATGCDIVRVAVPSQDDADVLHIIAKKSQIPVIADIHFQPKYVFAAIDAGCAAVRVNPGNIRAFDDQVKQIAQAASDAGRLDPDRRQRRLPGQAPAGEVRRARPPEALVESALWEASLFEEHGFRDFKISVKHHDPVVMVRAYEQLVRRLRLPAAPGRHRGRARLPGHDQVGGGLRRPARPAASATRSGCPCRRRRSKRSRSGSRSSSRSTSARAPGDRLLPVVRTRPGGRLQAGRRGHRGAGPAWRSRCGSPSWAAW